MILYFSGTGNSCGVHASHGKCKGKQQEDSSGLIISHYQADVK